jgi:hypothetical protein
MVALDGLVPKTNGWLARLQAGTTMDEGYGQVYRWTVWGVQILFFLCFICSGQNPSSTDLLARPAPPPTSTHKVWIQNNVIVLLTEREAVQVGGYSQ